MCENGNNKIAVLHCVSSYPSPIEEQNLNTIPALKKKIKTIVGLSDHTLGTISAVTSVALGASIIEKHFNLNDNNKTVDSFFSLKKNEFKTMVEQIRNVEKSLGKINLGLTKSSKKNLNSRRSIYVTALIKKGEILTTKNIRVVRPAFGLSPKLFKKILGKKVNKDLFLGDRMKFRYISK